MNQDLITVGLAVVTALSSTKAWEYWQQRSTDKQKERESASAETHLYRDDLRKEVSRLRSELQNVYVQRENELKELNAAIAELREQLATFKTRVEFLEKENEDLRGRLA